MNDSSRQPLKKQQSTTRGVKEKAKEHLKQKEKEGRIDGKLVKGPAKDWVDGELGDDNKNQRKQIIPDYLEPSDEEEKRKGAYKGLTNKQKQKKIIKAWRTVWNNSQSVVAMLRLKEVVTTKIHLFGRQLLSEQLVSRTVKAQKTGCCIIMPGSKFMMFWNMTIIILLFYSCVIVPVQVAFFDPEPEGESISLNTLVSSTSDALFFADIFVNFMSAYVIPGTDSIEVNASVLAKEYLLSWFAIDLIACVPVELFQVGIKMLGDENDTKAARYSKLARLPRIYRIVRIIRIFKILKVFKYNKGFGKCLAKFKFSAGTNRVIKFVAFMFFLVHLFACVWFLQARLLDFDMTTWVYRMGLVDEKEYKSYIMALYWAFQTITTVGYGDFGCANTTEYVIHIFWMIAGVVFYSILVASVTSQIAADAANKDSLTNSLKALEDFAKETNLEDELTLKIRAFLLNNQEDLFSKVEEEELLNELPISMKEEVLYYQHGGLVESIKFLSESDDNEFVWALVQQTQKIIYDKDDPIYWQSDYAENFYMLEKGRVKLFGQNGFSFMTYKEGDMFGDSDALLGELRDCKAAASMHTTLHSVKMEQVEELFELFPDVFYRMKKVARMKRAKHARKIAIAEKKFPIYGSQGVQTENISNKLTKMGIVSDQTQGVHQVAAIGVDVMPMYDDVDNNFDQDNITAEVAEKLKGFLRKKTENATMQFNQTSEYAEVVSTSLSAFQNRNQSGSSLTQKLGAIKQLKQHHPLATGSDAQPQRSNKKAQVEVGKEVGEEEMKQTIEVQRVLENDENLGVPEAQATLEVLHLFNRDSDLIAQKMAQITEIVKYFKESSEHFVEQSLNLENQTVAVQERQLSADANISLVLQRL